MTGCVKCFGKGSAHEADFIRSLPLHSWKAWAKKSPIPMLSINQRLMFPSIFEFVHYLTGIRQQDLSMTATGIDEIRPRQVYCGQKGIHDVLQAVFPNKKNELEVLSARLWKK